ncbi:guanylate kinase [Penicillium longicatenatum]|uniref:guanylate kinase n=1 Tax=Penicillium longicatenatum TaxID=1561947 RepID=UPI002546F832|nr:guanylate kinase [Penicillium longicatenatum]KAJ5643876.1 guanylate kinase [Penicillium longicatenatum]KAJ5644755.1 guanylate kinase [Penicillium longicatenatum]
MPAPKDTRPIVISGPSGVGKGSLIEKLFSNHPNTFAFTVSHTTRKPRAGEVDGTNYFFVEHSEFDSLVAEGAFVEHAVFGSNKYGTSHRTIGDQMAKGLVVVLDIEMNGVKQMKENDSIDPRYVFIQPPSLEILEARLRGRGTENDEDVRRRLAQATAELEYANQQRGVDKIIVNDDLEVAYKELEEFIFQ